MASPKKNSLVLGTWLIDRVNIFFRVRRYVKWVAERWFILAISLVISVSYAVYKALPANSPDIYLATSKIGIAPKIQTPNTSQAQYMEELTAFYENQVQYMNSGRVIAKVNEKTLDQKPRTEGFQLVGKRAVRGPAASFVMEVESTDRTFARLYAKEWARTFIEFKNELREEAFGKSAASTRVEMARTDKNLEEARAALLDFQRKNNIGSAKDTGDAAQQRLDRLESSYQDVKILRQRLENRKAVELADGDLNDLRSEQAAKAAAQTQSNPDKKTQDSPDPLARFESAAYSELRLQLKNKETERARFTGTLKPAHPYMRELDQAIQSIKQRISDQLELIEETRIARIKSLKSDEDSYPALIATTKKEVLDSRNIQYEYERLRDEAESTKQRLEVLRRTDQELTKGTSDSNDDGLFNILEEGAGPDSPVRPDRVKIVFAGLAFGLGFGLGLIYLLGRLDDRLELAEDIENELQERVLGQIPLVNLKELKQERVLVSRLDKHNMFAEALRGVRSAIMLSANEGNERRQVLIVSSAAPGDGKTTITTNLALTLAIAGHRVLLVDADLRRGNVHNYFGWDRDNGFSEVLAGQTPWKKVVRETEVKTLHVITSGKLPENPGELLVSPVTRAFIEEVRSSYDYIVFDCPPLTAIDDTFSLVGLADGTLFVVKSGQTSMRFGKVALLAVRQRGGRILGLILNGIKHDNPYYYYQQYYYTYYSSDETANMPAGVALNEGSEAVQSQSASKKTRRTSRSKRSSGSEGTTLGESEESETQLISKKTKRSVKSVDSQSPALESEASELQTMGANNGEQPSSVVEAGDSSAKSSENV